MGAQREFLAMMSLTVMMVTAPGADAQSVTDRLQVKGGQRVEITLADGQTVKGRVRGLTAVSIDVQTGAKRRSIAMPDVLRIRVHDPVGDGMNAGAKVGLVNALILFFPRDWCMALCEPPRQNGMKAKGLKVGLAMIATGAVIGGVLDAAQMTTVYIRPNGRLTMSLQPLLSATGAGVGLRLHW